MRTQAHIWLKAEKIRPTNTTTACFIVFKETASNGLLLEFHRERVRTGHCSKDLLSRQSLRGGHRKQCVLKETPSGSTYSPSTIASLSNLIGVGVDASGNVYACSDSGNTTWKIDRVDAPSLSFASTPFDSISSDNPKAVMMANIGNAALSFPAPSGRKNPTIASNFDLNSSAVSACPLLAVGAQAGTLAAGTSCDFSITFEPATVRAMSGSLVVTDDNLNAFASGCVSHSIVLSGSAVRETPKIA